MFEQAKSNYLELKSDFDRVAKRIIKRELSSNPDTLRQYKRDIIHNHNRITSYVSKFFHNLNSEQKDYFIVQLNKIRDKTIACFTRLNLNSDISTNLLQSINENIIDNLGGNSFEDSGNFTRDLSSVPTTSSGQSEDSFHNTIGETEHSDSNETVVEHTTDSNVTISDLSFPGKQVENLRDSDSETDNNMPQTEIEFLNTCSKYLHNNYAGNPLSLQPFIKSVKLLQRIQGDHADILLEYILTKLEGRALEAVPQEPHSVDEIIEALQREIKPDSSDVIEGRMIALKYDNKNVQDFSKTAEELAEALERSLIVEGMTQAKAREITIKNTVKMCRNSARCDLLRSVLASTQFENAKEVVAKFIVEQATETTERQVLAYRAYRKKDGRGRGKNNYSNYSGNGRGNNHYRQYNNNGNSYRGNRGRGGRGRGKRGGYQSSGYGYNNQGNFNNSNERYVRVAENVSGPSSSQDWRASTMIPPQAGQSSFIQYRST